MAEHPGKMLRQFLDAKGWTQDELAAITGSTRQTIGAVMAGRSGITPDMAVRLSAVFPDTKPEEWLQWDAAYQLSLLETDGSDVERRAKLYAQAPIKDMQKRGWIGAAKSTEELEAELARFFGGDLSKGIVFSVATLRTDVLANLNPAETAWCFRAKQLALAAPPVAVFDAGRLDSASRKLRVLAAYPKETEHLAEMLAYFGIRFVVVEPLPGVKIDGAAFWLEDSPVIAVSARWDRIDAFWFTVMHEFMHIKNGDAGSVDVNLVQETNDKGIVVTLAEDDAEQKANEQAADLLVPKNEIDSFIKRTSPLYGRDRIVQFANRIKMHPGIIVGQLQHRGELRYSAHRELLVKVRQFVTDTALTDGWGRSLGPSVM